MKKGLKVLIGLASFCVMALPLIAQPSSKSVETKILDNFDKVGSQDYYYPEDGQHYSWDWDVTCSRFIAEGYPKKKYVEAIPNSLGQLKDSDDTALVLGVNAAFNRKGDNWFEVYPVRDDKPFEVPFVGTVAHVDFWVWGANYNYYLELLVRDANGRVHVLPAGSLRFNGWRNLVVKIPGWMVQHSALRSGPRTLTFVGFRVRSDAEEFVDDFAIYFDQIKYSTNALSNIFDGYELLHNSFDDDSSAEEVQ